MYKKYLLCMAAIITFTLIRAGTGIAAVNLQISIDGTSRDLSPPPQLVNNRTMVPLRFIIEDQALQGEVAWEAQTQKVSAICRGKCFEFYIGRNQVYIDGSKANIDSAPYIYQNRTYIPLRFLAEQLGARVDWNSRLKEVAVYFDLASAPPVADKPTVFAYYYGSVLGELKDNAGLFTDVAFRWLETNDKGELFYEYRDDYDGVLQYTRNQGIRTHASVVFMDRAGLHTLLSTEANRNRLINNLATRARDDNYDGVNIDFEFLPAGDRDNFTRFLRDLKVRLGDKCLSVAVFACTKPESWLAGYDYQAIGSIADQIVVMAYDYSYKGSAPGPVAPLWWVEDATAYLTAIIPNEKLLLGMPTYGYDWGSGVNATTVTARRLADLDNKYGLSEHFDNKSMSPYYTYVDSNNVYHQIWLENQLSLEKKYEVAVRYNLGGVSFWRIGNGFKDLYAVLARNVE